MNSPANYKVLIVENDVFIADHIESILTSVGYTCTIKASNFEEACILIKDETPNLLLLDINLEGSSEGIQIGAIAARLQIPFAYITGQLDIQTVDHAVKTNPINYLTKPIKEADLIATVKLAHQKNKVQHLSFKDGYSTIRIFLQEIQFVKSDGNYIDIFTAGKKYTIRMYLKQFIEEVQEHEEFIQVHRSYIVNQRHISRLTSQAAFVGDHEIPISRSFQINQ